MHRNRLFEFVKLIAAKIYRMKNKNTKQTNKQKKSKIPSKKKTEQYHGNETFFSLAYSRSDSNKNEKNLEIIDSLGSLFIFLRNVKNEYF